MSYGNAGALIKRSIIDLVRAGCRVERVAHDPPGVSFIAADGSPSALRVDGRVYVLASPHGLQRFHSLDAALSAVARPRLDAASWQPWPRSGRQPYDRTVDSTRATILLLVRHAETVDNVAVRLAGWTDSHLTPRGEAQVELLAAHFNRAHGHAAAVYASPLVRTRRTAEAIGALTGHAPIFDDDLREMHFGELDGLPYEQVRETHAELLASDDQPDGDFAWPAGESRFGFTERVHRVLNRIAGAHPGETVAVVTHGGVISTFLTIVHGQPPGLWREWLVSNASLTEVAWDPVAERGRLLRRGDDAHLAEMLAEEAAAGP